MVKQIFLILGLATVAGCVYLFLNYEIQPHYEGGRLAYVKVVSKAAASGASTGDSTGEQTPAQPTAPFAPTFRLATFHLGRFDEAKQAHPRVSDVLARLFSHFDLIAVQGIHSKNQGVLIRLAEQVSAASGRVFDFATSPTQQRDAVEHYNAFLFDRARFDIDRATVRFVEDRRFRTKPLVGEFRLRGPTPAEAFTFTLINVATDPDNASVELDMLADVFRTMRDDGRNEDDIILLGDLESDDTHLGRLGRLLGVEPLLSNVPTTVRGTQLLDNILLDRRATSEFIGRVEVVDLLREFELTMPDALEVSEHLPVWAEFSVFEGGQPGHLVPDTPK
jgi:deoxyribonuclease-1-like protein